MLLFQILHGMTIKEAKNVLEDLGLNIKLNTDTEEGIDKTITTIKEQTPKKGIKLETGGSVMCDI